MRSARRSPRRGSLPGPFLDFLDPWGNRIEIVGYENVQFTKAPNVLRGMGLMHLSKNQQAIKELTEKDMAPELETNRSLDKDAPISRPVQRTGIISSHAILGGLHHYVRV